MKIVTQLLVLLASQSGSSASAETSIFVESPSVKEIIGNAGERVESFLGLKYASVGERFSRSSLETLESTNGTILNATSFGPNCHQGYAGLPNFLHQRRVESEECLYLNVWRPSNATSNHSLPVMVWIHGGGFMVGSGADEVHRGEFLSRSQNVIVVTINYRLGALGFLPTDENGTGAMNGLHDQVVALKWIQSNIGTFGGDPALVTIFGESAGSESVCMLSVSPAGKGLFHRAIMQSGQCIFDTLGIPNTNIDSGLQSVENLKNATGASSLDALKKVDPAELNALSGATGWPMVVLDYGLLPQHPRVLYRKATNIVPKDMIVGANSNDDVIFMELGPILYVEQAKTGLKDSVDALVGSKFGSKVAHDAFDAYNADTNYSNDTVAAYSQFHGDWLIRCPSRSFASRITPNIDGNVFLYNFAHFGISDPANHFGLTEYIQSTSWASHLAEIPFVFGTVDYWKPSFINESIPAKDAALSREIMARWANFARVGNPSLFVEDVPSHALGDWKPLPKLTLSSSSSLRASQTSVVQILPVMVFENGTGTLDTLPEKAAQCATFHFEKKLSGNSSSNQVDDTNFVSSSEDIVEQGGATDATDRGMSSDSIASSSAFDLILTSFFVMESIHLSFHVLSQLVW